MVPGDSVCNLRDLGGLPLADGGSVRSGVLYRGDAPVRGDLAPAQQPWPPRTVVDLRTDGERASMAGEPWPSHTEVVELSLYGDLDPFELARRNGSSDVSDLLTGLFAEVIKTRAETLVEIVSVVATGDPPVMVHCTGGKDRTALAIALLLDAVGVETAAILADHARTNDVIDQLVARMSKALGKEMDAPMSRADEPSLRATLGRWHAYPGGSPQWLIDHGLAPGHLEALRDRLIDR